MMHLSQILHQTLSRIDGKGYKAYKDIQGSYEFEEEGYILHIDYVQGDPFASPSKVRVVMGQERADFPHYTYESKSREVATRDFITRRFAEAITRHSKGSRGSGKSGRMGIYTPGQEILERTSAFIDDQQVEVRFTVGLPAFGRKIAGRQAQSLFFEEIPRLVKSAMIFDNLDADALQQHIETNEDADAARDILRENEVVAFVADHSILPRKSGIDPRPMPANEVIPFESPQSMRWELELPNLGKITGMGIPTGITLIVGGGFHGKSTLLNAIEAGIYNHMPGDGREFVVSDPDAVKIRSEDGRRIEKVDISPFINNLPLGKSTRAFSTDDASGSTSQAANIVEAIELAAKVLLIDEDTSATNFMIRDQRMQELIHKNEEPITPFIDKVKQLYNDLNVSTILVMGGSGDYFEVADQVIGMNNYKPEDLTGQAKAIHQQFQSQRDSEGGDTFGQVTPRAPLPQSIQPEKGKKSKKIKTLHKQALQFGTYTIDLSSVEQLADASQTTAIGEALVYAKKYMDGQQTLSEIAERILEDIREKGINVVGNKNSGNYARFRRFELAAALNRLRSLEVRNNID
ncbi:MAG: ABC-ATPase domain-containing protein [Bacteroidales bacterium]|nr:ABC-ATPase domain-containing protein [Bacteroidales bacterium]